MRNTAKPTSKKLCKSNRFTGTYHITEMELWDEDYFNMEVQAFLTINDDLTGKFQFGLVSGVIDGEISQEDPQERFTFTWEGNDECDPAQGNGWLRLSGRTTLEGRIKLHNGDSSFFRAQKKTGKTGDTLDKKPSLVAGKWNPPQTIQLADRTVTIPETFTHSTMDSGEDHFIKDKWKKTHHFKIANFPVPTGIEFEALEITKDGSPGYEFRSLCDFDEDLIIAKEDFLKKLKQGINRRHLQKRGSAYYIGPAQTLRGRIEWSEDASDTEFNRVLVIDGKRIRIEEFVLMLEAYEGWNFKFEIFDPCEEIP